MPLLPALIWLIACLRRNIRRKKRYIGRGFVSLPQEGHFIGEEVEVEPEGDEFIENFIPVNSDK